MAIQGIVAKVGGALRSPVPNAPLVSSSGNSPWRGFILEKHFTPAFIEFPGNIKFMGHMIALNRCLKPGRFVYRVDGRTEREFPMIDGSLGFCSSQEIIGARQYGASMSFPLLVDRATMSSVVEEAKGSRDVELIQRAWVEDTTLRRLMEALATELTSGCRTGRLYGESLATAIAAYSACNYSASDTHFATARGGLSAQQLRDTMDYIQASLDVNLGVADIARVACLSSYYFGKLFKQSTGQSLHQYVLERRMQKAKILLATTQLPLAHIASAVGLSNQSHFSSVFKLRSGMTPRTYRARYRSTRGPSL